MSVAGLKYQAPSWGTSTAPAETKGGSYIYSGTASAFHDWEFRTCIRVLQHGEKQRREALKDLRGIAFAKSQSPVRKGKGLGKTPFLYRRLPTEDEGENLPTEEGANTSSGIPASPSSARRARATPDDAESVGKASNRSGKSGKADDKLDEGDDFDEEGRAYSEAVFPTLDDVDDSTIDMSECVQKVLEGLRGDAFSVARDIDIGLQRLLLPDGIDHLIEQIRSQAFPLQSEEASELFCQCQMLTGPLAKQQGEPMLSYIARRKRLWSTFRELDPDIRLSEPMRANLLVELSGLSRQEQLMMKTAARAHTVEEYARVLVQHHSVVHMKDRLFTERTPYTGHRPWNKNQSQTPKLWILRIRLR